MIKVEQVDREAADEIIAAEFDNSHAAYYDLIVAIVARHRLAERERCAAHLETRAAEILAVSTNHTTGVMMNGIFRAEATAIRETPNAE